MDIPGLYTQLKTISDKISKRGTESDPFYMHDLDAISSFDLLELSEGGIA